MLGKPDEIRGKGGGGEGGITCDELATGPGRSNNTTCHLIHSG